MLLHVLGHLGLRHLGGADLALCVCRSSSNLWNRRRCWRRLVRLAKDGIGVSFAKMRVELVPPSEGQWAEPAGQVRILIAVGHNRSWN